MIPTISVIIPVYNASSFLERCLNSVLAQTLSEIEVICIDDCSQDSSFDILVNYSKMDARIKVYKNENNIGQGLVRNKGIDLAKGEYIAFVDSDDWLENDMFEKLYSNCASKKCDVIIGNYFCDFSSGDSVVPNLSEVDKIDKDFLIIESIAPSIHLFSPNAPWGKLYRRDYLMDSNLKFESERVLLYEDKFFNLSLFVANPSIEFHNVPLYHYVIRTGSTMSSYQVNFKKRYFNLNDKIKDLFNENNISSLEIDNRFKLSLFELTFSFCLNAFVYNKSLQGKIFDFLSIVNDKRISSNTKFFKIKDIPPSSSKTNRLVKTICFLILKYLK